MAMHTVAHSGVMDAPNHFDELIKAFQNYKKNGTFIDNVQIKVKVSLLHILIIKKKSVWIFFYTWCLYHSYLLFNNFNFHWHQGL